VCDSFEEYGTGIDWVPKLHHLHSNGQIVSHCDVHGCKSCLLLLCDIQFLFVVGSGANCLYRIGRTSWFFNGWKMYLPPHGLILSTDWVILCLSCLWNFNEQLTCWTCIWCFISQLGPQLMPRYSESSAVMSFWNNVYCSFLVILIIFLILLWRSQSCVEYKENAKLRRHSIRSSLAVDHLLGILIGSALLLHAESVCL
jgi:phosphatidylinositol glycan class Q protein